MFTFQLIAETTQRVLAQPRFAHPIICSVGRSYILSRRGRARCQCWPAFHNSCNVHRAGLGCSSSSSSTSSSSPSSRRWNQRWCFSSLCSSWYFSRRFRRWEERGKMQRKHESGLQFCVWFKHNGGEEEGEHAELLLLLGLLLHLHLLPPSPWWQQPLAKSISGAPNELPWEGLVKQGLWPTTRKSAF